MRVTEDEEFFTEVLKEGAACTFESMSRDYIKMKQKKKEQSTGVSGVQFACILLRMFLAMASAGAMDCVGGFNSGLFMFLPSSPSVSRRR